MSGTISNALGLCDKFLADARAEKQAALRKAATDPSDPTTQPVMKADDGTVKATTGARSAENDADIRKAYGDLGNSGQEDSAKASSTHPSDSIGTVKMDSSEVKGNVQTPKAVPDKPSKPTGGAESPNHPSNDTFSEKYSEVSNIGKRILTGLASIGVKAAAAPVTPATPSAVTSATPAQEKKAEQDKLAAATLYKEDAEAGYMAAEFIAGQVGFNTKAASAEKQEDAAVDAHLEHIVKSAHADADLYAEFLKAHIEGARTKKAEGLGGMMMPASGDGSDGGAAGGTEIPPEALTAAAGGPEAGGPPPMGPEGAGPGGPGGPGGGGGEEAVLDALADALAQAGVTPEELAAAVAEAQAGGGGGGMEGGGGLPPEAMAGAGGPPPEAAPAPAPAPAGPPPPSAPKEAGEKKEEKKEDKGEKKEASAMQKAAAAIKAAVFQSNKNKLMGTIRQLVAK